MTEVTTSLVKSQLSKQQRLMIDDNVMGEIEKLAVDPDYGEEFLQCYVDHLNILKEQPRMNHGQYLNAIKFFSLVEMGNSLTDAYIKTFPDRYTQRKKNHPSSPPEDKSFMRGEASRYNNTKLVNEIRKVAAVPVQLIHRHLLHEAILENAHLMKNARSEMVRQKAADTLIRELKPAEEQQINVNVNDGATSAIEELRKATERLAIQEHAAMGAGVRVKDIAESNIIEGEVVEDDGDS